MNKKSLLVIGVIVLVAFGIYFYNSEYVDLNPIIYEGGKGFDSVSDADQTGSHQDLPCDPESNEFAECMVAARYLWDENCQCWYLKGEPGVWRQGKDGIWRYEYPWLP